MSENGQGAEGGTRVTALLVATAVVSAIAGFLYAYDTGIISGAILQIRKEFAVGSGTAPYVIACLIIFMFFTAGGLQVMGWLTGSEVYPLGVRGAGTSAQAATLWGSNVIITLTLLSTINAIGPGPTMWMYAGFNVLAFFFVLRYFTELAGRSLEDIETSLREGTFYPGGVPIKDESEEKAAT